MTDFRPVQGIDNFPPLQVGPSDTRQSLFIPDGSIDTAKVSELSVTKLAGIGIRVYNAAAANTLTTGNEATVNFDTVDFVKGFDTPSGTFTTITIPYDGAYLLSGIVEWANDDDVTSVWLYVNGAKKEGDTRSSDADSVTSRQTVTAVRQMTAGDTVGLRALQATGVDRAITAGSANCALTAVFLFPI